MKTIKNTGLKLTQENYYAIKQRFICYAVLRSEIKKPRLKTVTATENYFTIPLKPIIYFLQGL